MKPAPWGFTLIELLVTIAVAAILLTIGVPSFQELFYRNRVATVTNEFLTALNYARSEAVKNSQTTVICMSNNQTTCTANTGWANGWIIWVDRTGGGTFSSHYIVRVHGAINAGDATLVGTVGTQSGFAFSSQGALSATPENGVAYATTGDTINVCTPSDLPVSRQVVIGPSGLVSSQDPATALSTCP